MVRSGKSEVGLKDSVREVCGTFLARGTNLAPEEAGGREHRGLLLRTTLAIEHAKT